MAGEAVELLIVVIDGGLVDLSGLLAYGVQPAAYRVVRSALFVLRRMLFVFVFTDVRSPRAGVLMVMVEGGAMASGAEFLPRPENYADGDGHCQYYDSSCHFSLRS